jgi:hypothetical protein
MFYPSTAGSVTSFVQPGYAMQPSYYPAAPMSAVLPGQHYYPHMHAPMGQAVMYPPRPAYGYGVQAQMPYYGHQQPTVIVSSRSGRHGHHHRHHSRSRSRGFLGYL